MTKKYFISILHNIPKCDYLSRSNNSEYPSQNAAELAKNIDHEYLDSDRGICYK